MKREYFWKLSGRRRSRRKHKKDFEHTVPVIKGEEREPRQYSMQLQWSRGRRGNRGSILCSSSGRGEERSRAVFYAASWSIGDGEEAVESCCRRRASQRELKGCPPEADTVLLF